MRFTAFLLVVITLLAGCTSQQSDGNVEAPTRLSTDESRSVVYLGNFTNGLVYFSFRATGPDHQIWANYTSDAFSVTAYSGFAVDEKNAIGRTYGVGTLSGPNGYFLTVRGDTVPTMEEMPIEEVQSPGVDGHGLHLTAGAWNQTWWVAFGSANAEGPAPIDLRLMGRDIHIVDGPFEADGRLFQESDWSGTLDVRLGNGALGATATHERELQFATVNGTFLAFLLGSPDLRVESVALKNTTTTASWTGAEKLGSGRYGTPGSDSDLATMFGLLTQPDEWTLSVRDSVRKAASNDHVFLADVALPADFSFKL